ncbi:DUF2147 domain-containing protein [Rurimicrobium arvi]
MKPLLTLLLFITSLFVTAAKAQTNGEAILGKWANEDRTRVIEFVKTGDGYEAIIKEATDRNLIGQKQITGLQYNNNVYSGTLRLPKKRKTFPCTANIEANGELELSAKAGFMSKSQTWTKVK